MQGEMVTLCGEDHMENGWEWKDMIMIYDI